MERVVKNVILEKIVANKRLIVDEAKEKYPLKEFSAEILPANFAFRSAIEKTKWSLIAECKLTSPAKGTLCTQYSVPELAKIYTENGATALSVHTDSHFSGRLEDIRAVGEVTTLPILRKDFIIDEYQIYETRKAGADALLLIAHLLSDQQLQEYLGITHALGMDALVEVHTLEELQRVQETSAILIGINNRNLQTFQTDVENTFNLWPHCQKRHMMISESGISEGAVAEKLERIGLRGILVGEGLVKASNVGEKTRELSRT